MIVHALKILQYLIIKTKPVINVQTTAKNVLTTVQLRILSVLSVKLDTFYTMGAVITNAL